MTERAVEERIGVAVAAAREAGEGLLVHWRRGVTYRNKGAVDLVSVADRESEEHLRRALVAAFPDDGLVLEESGVVEASGGYRWFVDPLDGTTNFVHRHPIFAVSLGLARGDELVGGVVHCPAMGETYAARRGGGATLNGEPIRVSQVDNLRRALVATGFPYDRHERPDVHLAPLREVLREGQGVRRSGAAAVDLCWLAAGRLDAYYERGLKPWDTAAGALVVEEAGGRVSRFDGSPRPFREPDILATNGRLHAAMCALLLRSAPR